MSIYSTRFSAVGGPTLVEEVVSDTQVFRTSDTTATKLKKAMLLGATSAVGGAGGITKTFTFPGWYKANTLAAAGDHFEIRVTGMCNSDVVAKSISVTLGSLVLDTTNLPNSTANMWEYTLLVVWRDSLSAYVGSAMNSPTGRSTVASTPSPVLTSNQDLVITVTVGAASTVFLWRCNAEVVKNVIVPAGSY